MKYIIATLLFIIAALGFKLMLHETPTERLERIDRMAAYECNTESEYFNNNCHNWWQNQK